MGREVRMVPADWQHPKSDKYGDDRYRPMHDASFDDAFDQWLTVELPEWIEGRKKWQDGLCDNYRGGWEPIEEKYTGWTWEKYAGTAPTSPDPGDYMPDWPEDQRTHYMMYEDTSEGTPISPAFDTPEKLARWLADTGASAFGSSTASYEAWLRVCKGGSAPSAVISGGVMQSGVEAMLGGE